MLHDGAVTIVKRHEHRIKLNNQDIINLLRGAGHPVSDDAKVIVRVPGGGDWSNTNLDIGEDAEVQVTFIREEGSKTPFNTKGAESSRMSGAGGPNMPGLLKASNVIARLPGWIDVFRDAYKEVTYEWHVRGAEQREFGGQTKSGSAEGHWVKASTTVSRLVAMLEDNPELTVRIVIGPDGQDSEGYLSR